MSAYYNMSIDWWMISATKNRRTTPANDRKSEQISDENPGRGYIGPGIDTI